MTKPTKGNASAEKSTSALFVLGYDDQQKPCGARFVDANASLVAKAAQLMDLNVYEAANGGLADVVRKLPVGRLYSTGKGFVPNIRQSLYSEIVAALAGAPGAARGKDEDLPTVASGLPKTWDDIGPGHLVIAQESLENGWWEAICVKRDGDMLSLRFRDYPKLPKFARHKTAVALICPEPG
jgi:hypothetical protein